MILVSESSIAFQWMNRVFSIAAGVPMYFRLMILFLAILNTIVCLAWEHFVVDTWILRMQFDKQEKLKKKESWRRDRFIEVRVSSLDTPLIS